MKLGLMLCAQDPPNAECIADRWQENLELCRIADEGGLEYVTVPEHHFRDDGYLPAPLVAAAAIAAITERIQIATTITVGTLWQPLRLAEEAAMVDVLSRGRFTLGLGLGNFKMELDAFGVDKGRQVRTFEEVITIAQRAFTGDPVTFHGEVFDVDGLRVTPRPVRTPLPIWLGGMSEPGIKRAARFGCPLLMDSLHTIAELEPWAAMYRDECAVHGTVPEIHLLRYGWISDDPQEARELWWPFQRETFWNYLTVIPRFNTEGSDALKEGVAGPHDLRMGDFTDDRLLVGDSTQAAAMLSDWQRRLGAESIIVRLQGAAGPWGDPLERSLRSLCGPVRSAR